MRKLLTEDFVKAFYRNMLNDGCSNVDKVGWAMGTRKWGVN